MESILEVLLTSILPVIVLILVGVIFNYFKGIDTGPLNSLTLFVLTPALIFHSISLTELGVGILTRITFGVVVFVIVMIIVGWGLSYTTNKEGAAESAFLLIATFGNTGGLGIPMADFAFGEIGRQTAVLFAAIHGALVFTLGLYLASRSGGHSGLSSFTRVFKFPLVYAVVFAIAVRALDIVPPADSVAMETVGLVGESAIPMMLIILGVQLSQTSIRSALPMTLVPIAFRFGVSPLVGILLVFGLGFQNSIVAQVFILLTAMPVAIAPVIFTVEFASEAEIKDVSAPEFVSASVFITTIVSLPILTLVVVVLKSGIIV